MRQITKAYIHCSASNWGNLDKISFWHKDSNFRKVKMLNGGYTYCGYHAIIYNQYPEYKHLVGYKDVVTNTDGKVVFARPYMETGAGVKNDNRYSIHFCYVGYSPTSMQHQSLLTLCADIISKFNIPLKNILGHNEYYLNAGLPEIKTCPNIYMPSFRKSLSYLI